MPAPTDRQCKVDGCHCAHLAKGFCNGHYQQHRLGKPLTAITKSLPPRERFMSKVWVTQSCWEWQPAKTGDGYGSFSFNQKVMNAHRASWILFVGAIPEGREVDHRCHNRACVNPQHLNLVTRKQNMENQSGAHRNSKTGVRGVYIRGGRFKASMRHNGRTVHVGSFATLHEAESAVIAKRNELHTNNLSDRKAS